MIVEHCEKEIHDIWSNNFRELFISLMMTFLLKSISTAQQQKPEEEIHQAIHRLVEKDFIVGIEGSLDA